MRDQLLDNAIEAEKRGAHDYRAGVNDNNSPYDQESAEFKIWQKAFNEEREYWEKPQ